MKEKILEKIRKDVEKNKKDNIDIAITKVFDDNKSNIKFPDTNEVYFYQIGLDENMEDELYFDLESSIGRWIPKDKKDEFESNHNIVYGHEFAFSRLQNEFIIDMVKTNQEDAVKRIVKKYGNRR